MEPYDDALREILKQGVSRTNKRTGVKTRSIFGMQRRYRLDVRHPVLTRRKYWPKSIFAELLWFLSGSSNVKDLQALGSNIWNPWRDAEFEQQHGYYEGDLGPVYGFQLRHFGANYKHVRQEQELTKSTGVPLDQPSYSGFDQLLYMVDRIKKDPSCRRILFSLWNPSQLDEMRLPPCFVKGAPVLTNRGFKPIEDVCNGDIVGNSVGWNEVYETHKTFYQGPGVKFVIACLAGIPLTVTPNHIFWVKGKGWAEAKNIQEGDYLLLPRNRAVINPEHQALFAGGTMKDGKKRPSRSYQLTLQDWWLVGYYLGDGWRNGDRISFAVANKEKEYILTKIRAALKVSPKPQKKKKSCQTYETHSKKWEVILKHLGTRAANKTIPDWILDAPIESLEQLVEGYYDSDGCEANRNYHSFNTISQSLALGMQQVFWKLGRRASVNFHRRKSTCVIEGRTVNQKSFYSIVVKRKDSKSNSTINFLFDDEGVWLKVRKREDVNLAEFVYNLSVKDSHEYCTVVKTHNCHYTFQVFIDDDGRMSGMLTQRSCDFPIGVPANIQFYSTLVTMLAQQTGYKPYEFIHSTADSHIYEDQVEAVEEYLATTIIDSPILRLNKATDILSYKLEDFVLDGFKCGPKIEIPVAV